MQNHAYYSVTYDEYPRFSRTRCNRGIAYVFSDSSIFYCLECYVFFLRIFYSETEVPQADRAIWHEFSDTLFQSRICFICERNLSTEVMIQDCPDCSFHYLKVIQAIEKCGITSNNITSMEYNVLSDTIYVIIP